jgi:hypothetical protein
MADSTEQVLVGVQQGVGITTIFEDVDVARTEFAPRRS